MTTDYKDVDVSKYKKPFFLGIDVGGTNVKIGLIDDDGKIVADTKFPTQSERGADYAVQTTRTFVDDMLDALDVSWDDVLAAGLGTPGPMDIRRGMILSPVNLPAWGDYPIRPRLEEALGILVTYANDAAAAAFGEYWVGAGADYDSMVLITLGTGVGGGIIIDDFSIDGENSLGAEVGHITIDNSPTARKCGCGRLGHLEAYASATGVVARTADALALQKQSKQCSELFERITETSPLSALMVYQAAEAGDDLACQIVDETAMYLGRGLGILANVIDPAAFFLGGAMNFGGRGSAVGERFLESLLEETRKHCFEVVHDKITIDYAQLGGTAGLVGAAGLGRRDYYRR